MFFLADRVRDFLADIQLRGAGENELDAVVAGNLRNRVHLHDGMREDTRDYFVGAGRYQVKTRMRKQPRRILVRINFASLQP